MHASVSVIETLKLIVPTKELLQHFIFVDPELQKNLFQHLKSKNSYLYNNLDSSKRTIFLRDTGDNFRATKHFPTEQMSLPTVHILANLRT